MKAERANRTDESQRWKVDAVRSNERDRVTQWTVSVEHDEVVAETGRALGERCEGSRHELSFDWLARTDSKPLVRYLWRIRARGRGCPFKRRVDRDDDISRGLHRVGERLVGFNPGPRCAAEGESGPRIRPAEDHVVHDDLRWRTRQKVNQHRMHGPRPGPSAGVRLEITQRVLVDVDERNVAAGGGRIGGTRQPPVVGFELDAMQEALAVAGERGQDHVGAEDDRGRTKANQQPGDSFTHADHYRWGSTR